MSPASLSLDRLRREFDDSFAAPQAIAGPDVESLLQIRVAGQSIAVRTLDILEMTRKIPVAGYPSPVAGLLGIAALRGMLLPIYNLAALLDLPQQGRASDAGGWLMVANRETPVGLLFDEFEAHLDLGHAGSSLMSGPAESNSGCPHLRVLTRVGNEYLPVLDVAGIVAEIRKSLGFE